MAESVVKQVTSAPAEVVATVKRTPVTAVVVALIAVSAVVLIEIFYPGAITGKIRRAFGMVGIKGAA